MASSSCRWRFWYSVRCCFSWCRLSWVSSKSCSRSTSIGHPFISFAASRLIVTCLFLGQISLLIAPNSAMYSEVSVKIDISQLLLLIFASEQPCIFVFLSSGFLVVFFSRLLAGRKVGFSVLPLALLLCRQMPILTSFNTNAKLQHDCFLHELCSPLFLGLSHVLGIPANNVSWSSTSGCSCVACHWPDDGLFS